MGMIKSRSIIPYSPTDNSQRTIPHHSAVTGIDITRWRFTLRAAVRSPVCLKIQGTDLANKIDNQHKTCEQNQPAQIRNLIFAQILI